MDSIQSFYNSDSKKLTQLNPPSRYHTHIVLFHLLLLLSTLSVSDFFILTIVVAASYTQNLPGNQETYHSSVEPTQLVSACLVVYTYCWNSFNLQQALRKPSITPVLDCTFTSVSSDESKFLEDFMTFASDFSNSASKESKESRASLTELTVCDRTGNLSRPLQEVQAACTVGLVRKIKQI